MVCSLEIGRVVEATAGRDVGKYFVICDMKDGFLYLSDGKYHKTTKLKQKNKKHITTKSYICDKISSGYVPGAVTDAYIRRYLKQIKKCECSCKEE